MYSDVKDLDGDARYIVSSLRGSIDEERGGSVAPSLILHSVVRRSRSLIGWS